MNRSAANKPFYERHIPLEGSCNFRDLGGYVNRQGRLTRRGKLFRSDSLHRITEADCFKLRELDIRKVIDLRNRNEISANPSIFEESEAVIYHHIQFHNEPVSGTDFVSIDDLGDLYIYFIETCQLSIRKIIESILASPVQGAIAFHCTAGKDRTGVIAAILLDVADVDHDTIAEDYKLSVSLADTLLSELRTKRSAKVTAERFEKFLECHPDYMLGMLTHLHQQYGGSAEYLLSTGLSGQQVDLLREMVLT